MTTRKTRKARPKVEKIELSKETVQELTENDAEAAGGRHKKTGLPPVGNCLPRSLHCPMDTAKCGPPVPGRTGVEYTCRNFC